MYKNILVPLDGSRVAEKVLPYVKCLAEALKTPVHLLNVKEPETTDHSSRGLQGSEYLQRVASSSLDSLTVRCLVEIGKPAEVIVNTAAQDSSTLIVMSARARSGIQRWRSRSVARTVLDTAQNPVLLLQVREQAPPVGSRKLAKITAWLDGSPEAENVLPQVLELGKALKLETVLVRTYSLPRGCHAFAKRFYAPYADQMAEKVKEEAKNYIGGKVRELQAKGLQEVSGVLAACDTLGEISNRFRRSSDTILAVHMHRSSAMARFAVGNLMRRVVLHWADPVLIVRSLVLVWSFPLLSLSDLRDIGLSLF